MHRAMAVSRHVHLAATIAAELHQREGRNLVAVGLYGSVARGEEREYSDIDLLVVVHRKRTWIRHTFRDGILVTILQQTPEEAHDEVTGSHPGLNDALGGWSRSDPCTIHRGSSVGSSSERRSRLRSSSEGRTTALP